MTRARVVTVRQKMEAGPIQAIVDDALLTLRCVADVLCLRAFLISTQQEVNSCCTLLDADLTKLGRAYRLPRRLLSCLSDTVLAKSEELSGTSRDETKHTANRKSSLHSRVLQAQPLA